jgi:tRNA U34 2-thiouridine synthase MnmA/TrmU
LMLICRVEARLQDPIGGVAPGQVLAVYNGDECLGSGMIRDTITLGDAES